jgi:hypothetical protein
METGKTTDFCGVEFSLQNQHGSDEHERAAIRNFLDSLGLVHPEVSKACGGAVAPSSSADPGVLSVVMKSTVRCSFDLLSVIVHLSAVFT